jgi:hypothetical protein
MKTLIIALLTLTSTIAIAQNTVTWKGGTPGNETNWNESKNWSNNQVPDEFTNIIIKALNTGHFAQPVVSENVEVASIEIQAGAKLTVTESGQILIDGIDTYSEGIVSYGGLLVNEGIINLVNIDGYKADNLQAMMEGNGLFLIDSQPLKVSAFVKE